MTNFWQKLANENKPFLALSPMDGVTDFVFREIIAQTAKPDVFFTEFVNTDALCSEGRKKVIDALDFSSAQRPIVAQIWGTNPKTFFESAKLIQDLGFDGIDINMGCPYKAVVKIGGGAGLIQNKELATKLIQAVKEGAPKLPLSVKTRLGFNKIETETWIGHLLKQELSALSVHGRIATQMSKNKANWDEIQKTVELRNTISPQTIIIGNGDITSYAEAVEKYKQYGVDGVMIGRGIFKNPWVFEKNLNPQKRFSEEYIKLMQYHVNLFNSKWGNTKNFETLKKFFKIYIKDFKGANALRQELMLCKTYDQVTNVMTRNDLIY